MRQFLVSNDDGIEAEGIKALVKALVPLGKVYVTAPSMQQSAMGMALSLRDHLKARELEMEGAECAWEVTGTPADCVKYGLQVLENRGIRPDYVIGGINMGANLGLDVHYSGTVACAREGAMSGIRSIALSVVSHEASHFKYICSLLPELLELSDEFDAGTILNVNTPNLPVWKIKGVKIVPAGSRSFEIRFVEKTEDGAIGYQGGPTTDHAAGTDLAALHDGYAVITPLTISPTDWNALQQMRRVKDAKAACLFVDFQEKLLPAMRKPEKLLDNVTKFARCVDRLDLPVIVTQQYTRGLGQTVPQVRQALHHFDKVEKLSFSCWGAPGFADKISATVLKSIVIAGIESHICVQQTALDFLERGYEVTILRDCCASRKKEDHEAAMQLLAAAGCKVTTWEAFVYQLLGSSTHTAFRAVSAIVKGEPEPKSHKPAGTRKAGNKTEE
ncbi:MAG: 5'/3'-nucleotidase SurE [Mogibacterium sp.]|nr:5'/3'-nucleotidase SurE [Mogibacterium sp.]